MVRASGLLEYDVAAVDVAYSAGPYPDPPREIRSANGKIYVHWHFYRDERQCATSGVDSLHPRKCLGRRRQDDDGARPGRRPAAAAVRWGWRRHVGRRLGDTAGGPRRLQRFDDNNPAHRAKRSPRWTQESPPPRAAGGAPAAAPARAPAQHAGRRAAERRRSRGAQAVALRWFTALAAGDTTQLLDMAALPFKTNGKDVARRPISPPCWPISMGEGVPRVRAVQLVTAAALRAAIGKLPPSLDDTGSAAALLRGRDGLERPADPGARPARRWRLAPGRHGPALGPGSPQLSKYLLRPRRQTPRDRRQLVAARQLGFAEPCVQAAAHRRHQRRTAGREHGIDVARADAGAFQHAADHRVDAVELGNDPLLERRPLDGQRQFEIHAGQARGVRRRERLLAALDRLMQR